MNFITISCIVLIAASQISAKSKYNDEEDHPYEFGFTVDGQQHRHEMKDANGIIQGEFGFITADGIYHTTVYATDENGNFKILSMRNVRVSPPLDQLEGKIQSFQQGQNPPATPPPPPTARPQRDPSIQHTPIRAQPPPPPPPTSIQHTPIHAQPPPPPQYVTSTHAPFTTPSTIKPACAGCGYITTKKPIPGEKPGLAFQTLVFQNPGSQIIGPHKVEGARPLPGGGANQFNAVVGLQQEGLVAGVGVHDKSNNPGFSQVPPGSPPQHPIGVLNQNPTAINGQRPSTFPVSGHPIAPLSNPPSSSKYPISGNQVSHPIAGIANKEQIPFGDPHGGVPQFNPNPAVGLINTPNHPFNGQQQNHEVIPRPIRDDITVNNGQIQIPNHTPIKIQDKFPGMVDGLPPGVSERDITDLLYRFNYTVGFHGHYEKGYKNGAKVGGYFVNDRDGVSRIVTYVADENGYRPKVKFIRLSLDSDDVPKEGSEKKFGLKSFEFVWYPIS